MAKMVSLAMSKNEVKKESNPLPVRLGKKTPRYPWGTELRFENETLNRLKEIAEADVGDKIELVIKAEVVSKNKLKAIGTKEFESVCLQVTHIGASNMESFGSVFKSVSANGKK